MKRNKRPFISKINDFLALPLSWVDVVLMIFIICILILTFWLIGAQSEENVLNKCCTNKGGQQVTYSGCHSSFFADCKDAHKSGWYCVLGDSELNKSEVFKECTILVQGTE